MVERSREARPATRTGAGDALHIVYGGTFDPVHNGHLAIARAACAALAAPVHLTPAADPPHRAAPGADAVQRARMVALAIQGEPGLVLDERELGRDGPSYTVDTLRELRRERGPAAPLALLLGADSLLGLTSWHQWRVLPELAHLIVADRRGSDLGARLPPDLAEALGSRWTGDAGQLRRSPAGRVLRLQQPLHPGSATAVRQAIAAGGRWRDGVPVAVADYILRHHLYGVHGTATGRPL